MFKRVDKKILYTTLLLIFIGILIFFSASLSVLENIEFFTSVVSKQFIAIFIGLFCALIILKTKFINGQNLRIYSPYILIIALIIQLLVLVPNIGLELHGAKRWIDLGIISIQPSEFFKYAIILFLSAVLATQGKKLKKFKRFFLIGGIFFIPILLFYLHIKDLGTLLIISATFFVIFLLSACKKWHLFSVILIAGTLTIFVIYNFVPHAQDRIDNFLNEEIKSFQNKQMILTIGSGEITGRGFGSSIQKYSGLIPEPLADSIFPVFAEETGFIGSSILIILFFLLSLFILLVARKNKNSFEKMIIVGFGFLILFPVFYNIASSMNLVPLSGMPITFISKGGTSMVFAIIAIAIILQLSKRK